MSLPSSETADDPYSYFYPMGYMNSSSCGYCNRSVDDDGNTIRRFMFYVTTHSLKPSFYQTLVDRCWRRSGDLVYRPNQKEACCPHYTIRLDASAYRPSKDHRQTTNRFNQYVIGSAYKKVAERVRPLSRAEAKRRNTDFNLCERIHEAEKHNLPPLQPKRARSKKPRPELGGAASGTDQDAVPPLSPQLPPPPPSTVEPAHQFEVTLEPDTYSDEKYEIYANYQRIIHKEPDSKISKKAFTSFLCNSPLRRESELERDESSGGIREKKLGSYHQCYRLDGRLVAVGVLDLLPHCVSAVYFMYHESIHAFNPGKLSAMREIALAIEGGYKWWYSGYYISTCPKMRYKLGFKPQYVLDPETFQWDLFDKETQALCLRQPYVSLSRERRLLYSYNRKNESADGDSTADGTPRNSTTEDEPTSELGSIVRPLFRSNMPGLPSLETVAHYNLEEVLIMTSREPEPFPAAYLVSWATSSYTDNKSIKCKLAELVALMGEDLVSEICLDFRRI